MPKRLFIRRLLSGCLLVAMSGCGPVGPNHETPAMALPGSFSQGGVTWQRHATAGVARPQAWWRLYHDATLTGVEERALAGDCGRRGN